MKRNLGFLFVVLLAASVLGFAAKRAHRSLADVGAATPVAVGSAPVQIVATPEADDTTEACPGATPEDTPIPIPEPKIHFEDRWAINGIKPGMTRQAVLQILNRPPISVKRRLVRFAGSIAAAFDDEELGAYEIWGTTLAKQGHVVLRVGDSRQKLLRVMPNADVRHPHPPQTDDWCDIYEHWGDGEADGRTIEDPKAAELFEIRCGYSHEIRQQHPYLFRRDPDACGDIVVVVKRDQVYRITFRYCFPCGKVRYYIDP